MSTDQQSPRAADTFTQDVIDSMVRNIRDGERMVSLYGRPTRHAEMKAFVVRRWLPLYATWTTISTAWLLFS